MADNQNNSGFELSWDGPIQKDNEFVILPEGEYDFEVLSFERARHDGSAKLPPCNKAVLSIRISSPEGQTTTLQHNLFLHSTTEGMLCAFFVAIGQRKHGEKMNMNWNKVIGGRGRCKLGVRNWKGKDGQDMQSNQINRFLEPAESPVQATPTYQQGRF